MSELKFSKKYGVLNVDLNYRSEIKDLTLNANDSVLLLGKSKDLKKVSHEHLEARLNDLNITKEWYNESLNYLLPKEKDESGDSSVSWLQKFVIHTVSNKCSRNNTPSGGHSISKIVRNHTFGERQLIIVACEKKNSIACATAVARVFPTFTTKTKHDTINSERKVIVAFYFTDSNQGFKASPQDIDCYNAMAYSVRLTARVVDSPCADMTTTHFLDEIKKVGKLLNIEPMVIEGEDLNRQGFGGLYNVGKAAINSPKLVVLTHLNPKARRTIAWVGKGIVFDTGGLQIKTKEGMPSMKHDCGGAAAVLGAFYTAVKLGFEDNLHGVFCLAENAVGPNAYRPDDIIRLYSGKSVEINNTDAEGRLVLGDGVAYASKDLKADIIVDIATLTGAQGVATGKYHSAVLTNCEKWELTCVDIGKKSGDLCFPLVYSPEFHFNEFSSEMADMKNSVANRSNATSACAGLFVQSHLKANFEGIWIHFDIASPVTEGPRATGFGVALLNALFANSNRNDLLKSIGPKVELELKPFTSDDCDQDY